MRHEKNHSIASAVEEYLDSRRREVEEDKYRE